MSANQPGVRIGALRGVPVYLGRSWFLIAVVVVLLFGPQVQRVLPGVGLGAYVVAGMYVLLLLVSVLVHEAAHALVGQARGYDVEAIVADLWGGHTSYRSVAGSPTSAALVAVVGPLSNLVLAGLGYLLLPHTTSDLAGLLLVAFVYANAFVGLFNLLPGLPLDGGHLVDALVWRVTGSRAAGTRAAGWCGRIVVLLIVGWFVLRPFVLGGRPDAAVALWVLFICGFLWLGASAAVAAGGDLDLLASVRVRDVLRPAGFAPLDLPVAHADVRPPSSSTRPAHRSASPRRRASGWPGRTPRAPPWPASPSPSRPAGSSRSRVPTPTSPTWSGPSTTTPPTSPRCW